MYQCPITYFTDNLIFNIDKSIWAAYKFTGYEYDFLPDEDKIAMLYRMAKFLSGVMSEAQILILPVEQDLKEYFEQLRENLDSEDEIYEPAIFHADQTEEYLKAKSATQGEANDYRSYILVKLSDPVEEDIVVSLKSGFDYFVKDPVNAFNVFMNLDRRDILMSKLESAIKTAQRWHYSQNQKIRLIAVDKEETQWLYRRMAFRGLNRRVKLFKRDIKGEEQWTPGMEISEVGKERVLRPHGKDIVNLFSGSIHADKRMIRIEHDKNRVSYQTFLALTNIPDSFDYPGLEWIYMLQQFDIQAELCIHTRAIEYREAQRKVEGKKQEIDQQIEHISQANAEIPEDLDLGREYANEMVSEIKNLREPVLNVSVTICLASDNRDDLENKVDTVRNEYENYNFVLERPLADQIDLFMQCIPTVGCIVKDYIMPITPLTLASGVIGATHELGDKVGVFIGTTGPEQKPVFLSLGRACLLNKSAATTFFGNLGVGKSFNANLLVFLVVLYGGYALIFDPKAERSHWEKELHILKGLITIVRLSGEKEYRGKLDPYNLYRDDLDEADELAINVLSELLKIAPTSEAYTAILEAQHIMRDADTPSMMKLIEILRSFPKTDELSGKAEFLARRLKLQADSGMAQLLFGNGTEDAITLDNRLNILQIDNLKLPNPETPKEDYSSEELLSAVLMSVLSNFAKKFAMTKRPVFKAILFDESWALGKTVEGVKLYDFLSRMGRSLYSGCIFNGHSVLDLPSEGIKNTISYKFCFQTQNDAEAIRMCEYMGLEATQTNIGTIKSLGNAECLFQDLEGHVGVLKFDAVFQDLIDVFSTTPKTKDKIEEQDITEFEKEYETSVSSSSETEQIESLCADTVPVEEEISIESEQQEEESVDNEKYQLNFDFENAEEIQEEPPAALLSSDMMTPEQTLICDFTEEELFRKEEI